MTDFKNKEIINVDNKAIIDANIFQVLVFIIALLAIYNGFITVSVIKSKFTIIEQEEYITKLLQEKEYDKNIITLHNNIGKASLEKDIIYNKTILYDYVDKLDVWFPEIIKAQITLESNDGNSYLAKNANNLFGMKKVYLRETTQESKDFKGYGVYKNYKLSILDRILWDYTIFKEKPNKEEYLETLAVIYAEDENYIKKLTNIIK